MATRRLVANYVVAGAAVAVAILAGALMVAQRPAAPYGPYPDLNDPGRKDIAMQLVSSAENSSLDWKAQYGYIEDIGDGRGYTGGIIGFTSGTGDMLELVKRYSILTAPDNPLAAYIPALEKVNGSDSHAGFGEPFVAAWKQAAKNPLFQQAQGSERDRLYFEPAVRQAKQDGLRTLGQFIYYDAYVMHGGGDDQGSFGNIRNVTLTNTKTPAQGGDEVAYLRTFLANRRLVMQREEAHENTSRIDDMQTVFLRKGNLGLNPPLQWKTYGDSYRIDR